MQTDANFHSLEKFRCNIRFLKHSQVWLAEFVQIHSSFRISLVFRASFSQSFFENNQNTQWTNLGDLQKTVKKFHVFFFLKVQKFA